MDIQPYFHDLPLKRPENQSETRGGLLLPNQGTSLGEYRKGVPDKI
jgi:hypothetical protein